MFCVVDNEKIDEKLSKNLVFGYFLKKYMSKTNHYLFFTNHILECFSGNLFCILSVVYLVQK